MEAETVIVLEGLPERVQQIADALDREFPRQLSWGGFAKPGLNHAVRLEGKTAEPHTRLRRPPHFPNSATVSGKAWKLNPSPGQPAQQSRLFYASLSKVLS